MRHRPVRTWWRPWRRRCACGCGWFPCPDSIRPAAPDPVQALRLRRNDAPYHWNGPTLRNVGPLLTPGQAWRSRQRGSGRA